jgi:hypothetical protein
MIQVTSWVENFSPLEYGTVTPRLDCGPQLVLQPDRIMSIFCMHVSPYRRKFLRAEWYSLDPIIAVFFEWFMPVPFRPRLKLSHATFHPTVLTCSLRWNRVLKERWLIVG